MKKAILTMAVIGLSLSLMAQTTKTEPQKTAVTPPVKHPDYQFDGNKPITLNISFTIKSGLVNDYLYAISQGGPDAIDNSQQISALQAKMIKSAYKTVSDTLASRTQLAFGSLIKADHEKFTADTTALYHPKQKH